MSRCWTWIVLWYCVIGAFFVYPNALENWDLAKAPRCDHLETGPLIPLEPEFPMGLTEKNRWLFLENPAAIRNNGEEIRRALERESLPWLLFLGVAGSAWIAWIAYLMREHLPAWQKSPPPRPLPPWQQASLAFKQLKNERLIEQNALRIHYDRLSALLLEALRTLSEHNQEMTTAEIGKSVEKNALLSEQERRSLLLCLKQLDLAKFGGQADSREAAERVTHQVGQFIHEQLAKPGLGTSILETMGQRDQKIGKSPASTQP